MLSQEARKILEDLSYIIAGQVGLELVQQGHNNTGTLIESVKVDVIEVFEGAIIECSTLDYGTYVNDGRRPGKFPPVDALRKWVRQRGLASKEKEVNSIAYVIGRAIAKEGSPTKGSYKHSKNGRRTNWIEVVLSENEEIINDHLERALGKEIEVQFDRSLDIVFKLLQ